MPRLLATVKQVAQARLHQISRRAALRGELLFGAAVSGIIVLVYLLVAVTVALSRTFGTLGALAIVAVLALAVMAGFLIALWAEGRRHRRLAARRAALDAQLYRAAALALIPSRTPSRPAVGLGLVALGVALVMLRRR